jgi:hypothetical protein
MALISTTLQPTENIANSPVTPEHKTGGGELTSLLGAIMLSVYAGQKSRKQLRKLKRQMTFLLIKQKLKNMFSKPADMDRKTLTIVLLAVLIVALVLIEPVAAIVLAILGLVLILTGVI